MSNYDAIQTSRGLLCNASVPWIRFRTRRFVNGEDISGKEKVLRFTPINRPMREFPVGNVVTTEDAIEFTWDIPRELLLVVGRIRLVIDVSGEWMVVSNLTVIERGVTGGGGPGAGECNCDCENAVQELAQALDAIVDEINKVGVPEVGGIEFNISGCNPSEKYPGTVWKSWGQGRVIMGVDDSGDTEYEEAEMIGGSETHTLTASQIPAHAHTMAHTHGMAHQHPNGDINHLEFVGANVSNIAHTRLRVAPNNEFVVANNADVGVLLPSNALHRNNTNRTTRANTGGSTVTNTGGSSSANTGSTGPGNAHSNMQPWITCFIWVRTA